MNNIISIDLGNKSRTAIVCMNFNRKILDYKVTYINDYKDARTHRIEIVKIIKEFLTKFKPESIVFEKINLFVGNRVSLLANIISLARIQTTIIDNFSDDCKIYAVPVQSWKKRVLGNAKADKNDAINYVNKNYPDVDLNFVIEHKRIDNEIVINHDLADAICIGNLIQDGIDLLIPKYEVGGE